MLRQDRFHEAQGYYERAYRELLAHDDPEGLAAVLSNLSLCYISLNEFSKALETYRMARQHCEQKGMSILVAYADYNIAYLYYLPFSMGFTSHDRLHARTAPLFINPEKQVFIPGGDLKADLLGEHNAQVLSELLGMPASEIDALHADGVLVRDPTLDEA